MLSETYKEENGKRYLLNPETKEFQPIRDLSEVRKSNFVETKNYERLGELTKVFLEHRKQTSRSGVGFGTIPTDSFLTDFTTETSGAWDIICPSLPGAGVTTWLY